MNQALPRAMPVHDGKVFHLKSPGAFSHLRFEWHPGVKRVYVHQVPKSAFTTPVAEPFAFEIETEAAAWNAVLIFLRGMKAAAFFNQPAGYAAGAGCGCSW